jgi:hypothetical protein
MLSGVTRAAPPSVASNSMPRCPLSTCASVVISTMTKPLGLSVPRAVAYPKSRRARRRARAADRLAFADDRAQDPLGHDRGDHKRRQGAVPPERYPDHRGHQELRTVWSRGPSSRL